MGKNGVEDEVINFTLDHFVLMNSENICNLYNK